MPDYYFEREIRTPNSEVYGIESQQGQSLGRVDIHYVANGVVHATLCIEDDLSEDDLQDMIGEIDERLVSSADPFREDFVVTVWRGRAGGVYSEEDMADMDEESESNGHNGHR